MLFAVFRTTTTTTSTVLRLSTDRRPKPGAPDEEGDQQEEEHPTGDDVNQRDAQQIAIIQWDALGALAGQLHAGRVADALSIRLANDRRLVGTGSRLTFRVAVGGAVAGDGGAGGIAVKGPGYPVANATGAVASVGVAHRRLHHILAIGVSAFVLSRITGDWLRCKEVKRVVVVIGGKGKGKLEKG